MFVIIFFREFSDESIGVNINIFSIFNMYGGSSWSWLANMEKY